MSSLRVFWGDESPEPSEPVFSTIEQLRMAFETLKLPQLEDLGRSRDTIGQYRRSVGRWERFLTDAEYRIGNPVLSASEPITGELNALRTNDLEAFNRWMMSRLALSQRERAKTLGDVNAILARAESVGSGVLRVERSPRLRLAGHSPVAPKLYFSFPRQSSAAECDPSPGGAELADSLCDLDRLWLGCAAAKWPHHSRSAAVLDPPSQWRAAFVLFATYGFRTEELIRTSPTGVGLPWQQVRCQEETPAIGGLARSAFGWLWYVPSKQRWAKPEPLYLPLTESARKHLDAIRPESQSDYVFDWPRDCECFYREWQRIVDAAKLRHVVDVQTGKSIPWQIKHFRKTASTWLNHVAPGVGGLITGHAQRSVEEVHYRNSELRIMEVLAGLRVPTTWQFWKEKDYARLNTEAKAVGSVRSRKRRDDRSPRCGDTTGLRASRDSGT